MHTSLLVLACFAQRTHVRADQDTLDDFATLLLAVSPSPLTRDANSWSLRTQEPIMQQLARAPKTASPAFAQDMGGPGSAQRFNAPILVQGGTLKTWSYASPAVERVQVFLTTEGRPLDADIELWQGPDNTPTKMRVYSEDGNVRPFNAVIETPSAPNTVAIRNIGQIEFPLAASLIANDVDEPISDFGSTSVTVQGGALRTYPFDATVQRVEIMLKTDGRPLNARIELLQGPNNNKQVIELYADDGLSRPFFAIIDTVGSGNVVRIVNTAPIEFPMVASVQPHFVDETMSSFEPVIGGD
eukprot:CAMPEP_0169135494 /NCGR_PEP_ID=MMETSP1015-20121227/40477_1 /TAXON_ID=342587 /ORGANISM="Karlodinium micrum, Strain CCMP2283" /LENGTH=299 /DNA_ID=CAMNT_0009200159 /DNA_START=52 /DNA_END=951 /DNA_ORIENTATION=-